MDKFVSLVNPILHWLLVMVRFLVPCVIAKAKLKIGIILDVEIV
jgi:hypothetical protein